MEQPRDIYKTRYDYFYKKAQDIAKKSLRLSHARLFLFVFLCFSIYQTIQSKQQLVWFILSFITLKSFIILVFIHDKIKHEKICSDKLADINDQAIKKCNRDWSNIPEISLTENTSNISNDLDIFGHASLFHLVATTNTFHGKEKLKELLQGSQEYKSIQQRQDGIKELAKNIDFIQAFEMKSHFIKANTNQFHSFFTWLEGETSFLKRKILLWISNILTVLTLFCLIILLFTHIPLGRIFVLLIMINISLSILQNKEIRRIFDKTSFLGNALKHYTDLFKSVTDQKLEAPILQEIQAHLSTQKLYAHEQISRLSTLITLADLRFSPMLHTPVQLLTLWDLHVVYKLEKWQKEVGVNMRKWMEALGYIEALTSLASFSHSQPKWCFPSIDPKFKTLKAKKVGHPLLVPEKRIDNDLELGEKGTFLFVTGSNMSGKSTLLRSIGLNIILAQSGGPVCAECMELPNIKLATSIRVRDSIEDGVSYFMAELKSLKEVIDRANEVKEETVLLYLLDEILQGTNTMERQIAVRRVLKHLASKNTIGAISSHDLSLTDEEELQKICIPIHFTEKLTSGEKPEMIFDYKIHSGIAQSTNALKLLDIVGIHLHSNTKEKAEKC